MYFLVSLALASDNPPLALVAPDQARSICFARGPYQTVYVSGMLEGPWNPEIPKAYAAYVSKKYNVQTYAPTCLSATSEANLEPIVQQQMSNYQNVPVVETGWTY